MLIKSMMPIKSSDAPMGMVTGTGLAPNISWMFSMTRRSRHRSGHFIDEGNFRHSVAFGLAPYGFGLRLNTTNRTVEGDGSVEYAKSALYFHCEINVAGGVDQREHMVFPDAGGGRGGDGDAAFLFLFHPVHRGGTIVHFADFVNVLYSTRSVLRRLFYRYQCAP